MDNSALLCCVAAVWCSDTCLLTQLQESDDMMQEDSHLQDIGNTVGQVEMMA